MAPLQTVDERFRSDRNLFGLLRLGLAAAVLISHGYEIAGQFPSAPLGRQMHLQSDLGQMAVIAFFALSGFLVYRAGSRSGSLRQYFWHRFLRIFPAFWVCLVVTAFVLAPAIWIAQTGSLDGFLELTPSPQGYVLANAGLGMHQYEIGSLLSDTPLGRRQSGSFNGSLWSLAYEFLGYIVVAGLVALGAARGRRWIVLAALTVVLGITVIAVISGGERYAVIPAGLPYVNLATLGIVDLNRLLWLLVPFLLGSTAAAFASSFPLDWRLVAVAAVAGVGASQWGGFSIIGVLTIAYIALWLATFTTDGLCRIGRRRDYSYGIYIYAFPIQQTVALAGFAASGHAVFVLVSTSATAAAAAASWHFVERPASTWRSAGAGWTAVRTLAQSSQEPGRAY